MATVLETEIENPEYINLLKVGLGLKELQKGLGPFIEYQLQTIHGSIISRVGGSNCGKCTSSNVLLHANCSKKGFICRKQPSARRHCPSQNYVIFYNKMVKQHRFGDPQLLNSDVSTWFSHPWEFAKCFMLHHSSHNKTSATQCDASALLTLIINCIPFEKVVGVTIQTPPNSPIDVFSEVREIRNSAMHSETFAVSEADMESALDTIISALQSGLLQHDADANRAATEIQKLKDKAFVVTMPLEKEVLEDKLNTIEELLSRKTTDINCNIDQLVDTMAEIKTKLQDEEHERKDQIDDCKQNIEKRSQQHDLDVKMLTDADEELNSKINSKSVKIQTLEDLRLKDLRSKELERFYGYPTRASANECDVLGLCSIIINCKHFGISFDRADVFSQEVTEHDTNLKLNTLVQALKCGPLNHDEDAKRDATEIMKELLKKKKEAIKNKLKAMEKTEDITRKAIEMYVDERQKATVACVADPQMEIDKSQTAKSKSSNKKTIFGKPFEHSCILDSENTTFQIPGSDVKVIFPNSLTTNTRIEIHGSSFRSIPHIRKRFDLPTSEEVASPVTEYHVTGCTRFSDYTCVKVPFVGPRSEVKVWKFLSDEGITNTTIRLQVPLKVKYSNEHLFYEVEGESTCSVYTRSFSGFFCTTDGHRPLKLRALLYASHKRFQPLSQNEVRIRMYIADEIMKFQDYKQTMDDIEAMQGRFQKEDKVLSLLEDDLTEDSNIEVCVTPTEDSSNQWVHKPNPHTGQPIFAEIQTLPLRDIVQKCPDCPGCHLQSDDIPYSVEWYLTNRQTVLPSLRFKGLVTVDCVKDNQRRSTALIIDALLRPEDCFPDEEIDESDRLRQIKGFVLEMDADKRQKLLEFFGFGPTFVNRLFDDLQHYYRPAGVFSRLVEAFSQQLIYKELDQLFNTGLIPGQYCKRPLQRVEHTNVSYSPHSSRNPTVANDNFLRATPTRYEVQSYPGCHPETRDASDASKINQAATVDPIMAGGSVIEGNLKTQMAESKKSNKQTIFGKPFEYSCVLDGENTTFQIPGSDVQVIFPNSLTKNNGIEVQGSSFRSIFHIRKRFDLPRSEALASPVTEYHVTGCTKSLDYACVKMPFVGPRSELKVWKFPSDDDITHTTTRIQVPLKGRNSNEHSPDMFYEVEGSSTCLVYTRSFSCFYCTTDGRRPLKLRAFSYASHKRFQSTGSRQQHEVRIRMYIADEVMKFQDYKQRIDDIENMQDRCQAEDKGLSLPEALTEDCIIEAYVTPTDDIDNQWVHKPEPNSDEPIFPEKQTHSLRDIVQQCPNSLRCHLQRDKIPYCLEWYLTNRQVDTHPSLSFQGFLNVDCVDNQQKGSTILVIEKLRMRQEVDVPAEESPGYYRPTGDSGGLFQALVNILRTLANAVFWTRPRIAGNTSIWAGIESGEERQVVTEGAEMKASYDCTMTQFLLSALNVHMPSVGALVSDRGQGTVFRVGSKYVMTAEHVVNDIIDPEKSGRVNVDLLKEDDVYITFSASLYQRGTIVFKIKEITYQYEDLDVAILEIENWQTSTFPRELVLCKCPLSSRVKEISLIGFGHPEDKSKKNVDPKCKIKYIDDVHTAIVYLNENIQMYKDMVRRYQGNCPDIVSSVDQLYNDFDNPDKLLWSCYMENGGSGSPVINHNDHKSLKVVALYTHAIPGFIDYLDPNAKPFYPCDKRFEMGPRMSSIFRDLQQRNIQLANELFPGDC